MARMKINKTELTSLGTAALFPVALFAQIAAAVSEGMPLSPHEAAVVQLFLEHGIARWGAGGQLELSPLLATAIANLAGTPADLNGVFTEMQPALELGMIRIPRAKLPAILRT